MTKKQAKAIFIWGTLISAVLFVALTVDSIRQFSERTHEQKLSPQVAEGKWVWQKHNCNDCHTILGIGGYYSPDLTKVMSYRDEAWMARFLRDPHKVWPAKRRMPDLGLSDREIASLISFLVWVNGIDTNDWPPKPITVSTAAAVSAPEAEGKKVYEKWGCSSCHKMGGVGGTVGPDLTHIGSKKDSAWLKKQIVDPQAHFANSIMPPFSTIPEKDLDLLVQYLFSLK